MVKRFIPNLWLILFFLSASSLCWYFQCQEAQILLIIFDLCITKDIFLHLVLKDEQKFEGHISEAKPQQEDPLCPPDTRHLLPYMSHSGKRLSGASLWASQVALMAKQLLSWAVQLSLSPVCRHSPWTSSEKVPVSPLEAHPSPRWHVCYSNIHRARFSWKLAALPLNRIDGQAPALLNQACHLLALEQES